MPIKCLTQFLQLNKRRVLSPMPSLAPFLIQKLGEGVVLDYRKPEMWKSYQNPKLLFLLLF